MNIVAGGHDAVLLLPASRNEGWQERTQARLRTKRTVHAFLYKKRAMGEKEEGGGGAELYKQVRMLVGGRGGGLSSTTIIYLFTLFLF